MSQSTKETPEQTLAVLRDKYETDANATMSKINVLIYGGTGSGKTYSLRTFRTPIWIDSFDPGGSISLKDFIADGRAIVNTQFEKEDADKPTAWEAWEKTFLSHEKSGVFNHIGTYAIDSATTWASAALNAVLKKVGRTGGVPQQNDWYPQMTLMEKSLKRIMSLPCDVVFICHDDTQKDEILGSIMRAPLLTGKLKKRVPLLFSEIYYALARRSSKGTEYVWQMQKDSQNEARSRLMALPSAKGSKFETYEPADFRALTKKFGIPYENLPSLKELNNV